MLWELINISQTGFVVDARLDLPALSYQGYLAPVQVPPNDGPIESIVVVVAFRSALLVLAVIASLVATEVRGASAQIGSNHPAVPLSPLLSTAQRESVSLRHLSHQPSKGVPRWP